MSSPSCLGRVGAHAHSHDSASSCQGQPGQAAGQTRQIRWTGNGHQVPRPARLSKAQRTILGCLRRLRCRLMMAGLEQKTAPTAPMAGPPCDRGFELSRDCP
eukprot:s4967_g11.t1